MPPGPVEEIETFTPSELALISADLDPELHETWRFFLATRLRTSELTWLPKVDVQVDSLGIPKMVHICK